MYRYLELLKRITKQDTLVLYMSTILVSMSTIGKILILNHV